MNSGDADPYAAYAQSCLSGLVRDASLWPIGVRDLGESFYRCWAEQNPDDWGFRVLAEAFCFELRIGTPWDGPRPEPFVPVLDGSRVRMSPLSPAEMPTAALELWNECLSAIGAAPLAAARLADLLLVRGHGDPAQRSRQAVDAYTQAADLNWVGPHERFRGLLRALELSRRDSLGHRLAPLRRRIAVFVREHPRVAGVFGRYAAEADREPDADQDAMWHLVVATIAEAWLMSWAEADERPHELHETGTLACDDDGMPGVPQNGGFYHDAWADLINLAIMLLAHETTHSRTWRHARIDLDALFKVPVTSSILDRAVERLTETDPAMLAMLAAQNRPMVAEAAASALDRLNHAGRIPRS